VLEIERTEPHPARQTGSAFTPSEPSRNHQVQHHPKRAIVSHELEHNPFPDSMKVDYGRAGKMLEWAVKASHEEHALETHMLHGA